MAGTSVLVLPSCEHILAPRPWRRLGQAQIIRCDRCEAESGLRETNLNFELLARNVANIDSRFPVVAVGSNASPGVMRMKMYKAGIDSVIPFVKAHLQNIRVAASAHVGRPGFIPAAPCHLDGAVASVVVGWLDRDQLAHLDATEPNYDRCVLSGSDYPLVLDGEQDGNESLESFHLYVSKWGVLREGLEPLELAGQEKIAAWLTERGMSPWVDVDAENAARLLSESEALRSSLRDAFVERDMVSSSNIKCTSGAIGNYGEVASRWPSSKNPDPASLVCCGTDDDLDRKGEQCLVLNPLDARLANSYDHAVVAGVLLSKRPGVVARIVISEAQPQGRAGVDQVIRNSLGVERCSGGTAPLCDVSGAIGGSRHCRAAGSSDFTVDISIVGCSFGKSCRCGGYARFRWPGSRHRRPCVTHAGRAYEPTL
jgi:hypothetical protein